MLIFSVWLSHFSHHSPLPIGQWKLNVFFSKSRGFHCLLPMNFLVINLIHSCHNSSVRLRGRNDDGTLAESSSHQSTQVESTLTRTTPISFDCSLNPNIHIWWSILPETFPQSTQANSIWKPRIRNKFWISYESWWRSSRHYQMEHAECLRQNFSIIFRLNRIRSKSWNWKLIGIHAEPIWLKW